MKKSTFLVTLIGGLLLIGAGWFLYTTRETHDSVLPEGSKGALFFETETPEGVAPQQETTNSTSLLLKPLKQTVTFTYPKTWQEAHSGEPAPFEYYAKEDDDSPIFRVDKNPMQPLEQVVSARFTDRDILPVTYSTMPIGNTEGTVAIDSRGNGYVFIPYLDTITVMEYLAGTGHDAIFQSILDSIRIDDEHLPAAAYTEADRLTQTQVSSVVIRQIDMEGDNQPETLVTYFSYDTVDGTIHRQRQHLKIVDENNALIKDDAVLVDNRKGFRTIEVYDFGHDGKEELFVQKKQDWGTGTYYVYGLTPDGLGDFPIAKGYLHPEKYSLCPDNVEMFTLRDVVVSSEGIEETYLGSTCTYSPALSLTLKQTPVNNGFSTSILSREVFETVIGDRDASDYNQTAFSQHDNMLWRGSKALLDKPLDTYLPAGNSGFSNGEITRIYYTGNTADLYLVYVGDCGGCWSIVPSIARVDLKTNKVTFIPLDAENVGALLSREITIFASPDEKKWAFVGSVGDHEQSFIYDPATQTTKAYVAFQPGEGVTQFDGYITAEQVNWTPDSRFVRIQPGTGY